MLSLARLPMSRQLFCVLACFAVCSSALRVPRGVAGDQPPQLYPAVTVHVPEPAGDASVAQASLDALGEDVARLKALELHIAAQEHTVLESFGRLGQQIQALSDTVGAMVS